MTEKYYTDKQLAARYAVARGTIWRWTITRNFPRPIKFSDNCSRFKSSEVEAWEKQVESAA